MKYVMLLLAAIGLVAYYISSCTAGQAAKTTVAALFR